MACDDRYAYMYEEGYTSDEDDVSDSLVTDIVEEAFRLEHEGNKNGRSESEERSFTEDNFLMQQNSAENLSRSFPRIQITEITDESELNENVVLTSLSESNCEHESTRSASECTLTERMVRFLPATPQNEPHEKRKYPTTPKPVYKTSGPSLTPLKADDSYPVQDDEQTTPLPYPADQTPSGSSDKFSDPVQETQKLMGALEDQLANLSLVMAKMETRQQSRDLNGCSPIRSASEGHFKGAGTEDSEVALQEGKELLKSLNLKWKTHKEHLADLLVEAGRREDEHLQLDRRVLEQADFVLKLQQERCALQVYLEEKEYEWMAVRRGYQADVNYIKSLIKDIKRSKEKNSNWHIVESLLRQHYNRQEAIAMDINKQNKISELHLLLCRQQLQLAEVNEENWQLEQQISELTGTPKIFNIIQPYNIYEPEYEDGDRIDEETHTDSS